MEANKIKYRLLILVATLISLQFYPFGSTIDIKAADLYEGITTPDKTIMVSDGDNSHADNISLLSLYKKISIPKGENILRTMFTPDGSMLIILTYSHSIYTFNLQTGKTAAYTTPELKKADAVLSNTGRYIAYYKDPYIHVFDIKNSFKETVITTAGEPSKFYSRDTISRIVTFSADDKYLIYTSKNASLVTEYINLVLEDKYTTIHVYDMEKASLKASYDVAEGDEGLTDILRISTDSTKFILIKDNFDPVGGRSCSLFDYLTGKTVLLYYDDEYEGVQDNPFSGNYVLFGRQSILAKRLPFSIVIHFYDANSGKRLYYIRNSSGYIYERFIPTTDFNGFITTSADKTIKIWELGKEQPVRTIKTDMINLEIILLGDHRTFLLEQWTDKGSEYYIKIGDINSGKMIGNITDKKFTYEVNIDKYKKYILSTENAPQEATDLYLWKINAKPEPYLDITGFPNSLVLKIDSPYMYVSGKLQEISPGQGTAPVLKNCSPFLPLRAVIEALGGNITVNSLDNGITVTLNDKTLKLWVNKTQIMLNGIDKKMSTAPQYIKGKAMLPLSFYKDFLGLNMKWYEKENSIIISEP